MLRLKTQHFHTKLLSQKPILRQKECGVQNGPITRNGVLPVTTLFFRKFCFSLTILYKELIWCTNHPNVHIHTSRKGWNFIRECFFPVSVLNVYVYVYTKCLCDKTEKRNFIKSLWIMRTKKSQIRCSYTWWRKWTSTFQSITGISNRWRDDYFKNYQNYPKVFVSGSSTVSWRLFIWRAKVVSK